MALVLATTNQGKILEFRQMLAEMGMEFVDLSGRTQIPVPEETGETFLDNACLKATHYALRLAMPALADDSGLEIDALGGKPGVHSARWAQMNDAGQGDADNNALVLRQMKDVPQENRSARFVCALALSNSQGKVMLTARETVEGRLLFEPRGSSGFGYDPLVWIDSLGRSMGELSSSEKHQISHRGKALRVLRGLIDQGGGLGRVLAR